jgi:hypothetical protein
MPSLSVDQRCGFAVSLDCSAKSVPACIGKPVIRLIRFDRDTGGSPYSSPSARGNITIEFPSYAG